MGKLFTVPNLTARGWTKKLIESFLPDHDESRPNPKYRNAGAPMKLYYQKRVLRIEKTIKFKKAMEVTNRRKLSAQKAVNTKKDKMHELVEGMVIKVELYDQEQLLELARANFRSLGLSDRVEISNERMCVNFLRHCGTEYENHLDQIAGMSGSREAYLSIKLNVLMEIANTYDWLAEECDRQSHELGKSFMNR